MFRYLLPDIGFPWTVRAIAFVVMGLYLISWVSLLNEIPKPPAVRRILDTSALTDWPYMAICFASIFSSAAYYIPMLYIPTLTMVRIPSFTPEKGFDLLAIINGASAVGRILIGLIAAKFGPTETITVSAGLASVILFCWIPVDTAAGIYAWSVFWGLFSGAIVALPGAFIPLFCPDINLIGTRNGMYWVWTAVGMLIGSPIGAAIYDPKSAQKGWWKLQVFSAVFMMAAAIISVYPSMHLRRKARAAKVSA
jgi:predicted MFS family arabinose efflux permease